MARPRKNPEPAPAPAAKVKRPGRPKTVQPVHNPDIDRIKCVVQDAINFLNTDVDHAQKIGYLGRCLEDLQIELNIRRVK